MEGQDGPYAQVNGYGIVGWAMRAMKRGRGMEAAGMASPLRRGESPFNLVL
jgi:hypothetical protein